MVSAVYEFILIKVGLERKLKLACILVWHVLARQTVM